MKAIKTKIEDLLILCPQVFTDDRGWFFESYNKKKLSEHGIICNVVQYNHSLSKEKNTIRGLHFQKSPKDQAKIVRCTCGKIADVAVDLRRSSPTYLQWVMVELSAENKKQLYIPRGFAHGFLTLTDNAEVEYMVDEFYSSAEDRTIRYDDPYIGITWNAADPVLSEKDRNAPLLKDSDCNFQ